MKKYDKVLVVFGEEMPSGDLSQYQIISGLELKGFIDPGSVYEAGEMLKELPGLTFTDGKLISKAFAYKGYELWWVHYNSLFYNFCLPYTQYKKLLEYLKDFQKITFYRPPHVNLFCYYLEAYDREVKIINKKFSGGYRSLTLGMLLQIIITLVSLGIILIMQRRLLVFIGDKLDKGKDHDFRMGFIYKELRNRKLKFIEFIRSLESWRVILKNTFTRRRPVIYSEAVGYVGSLLSRVLGGRGRARTQFGEHRFSKDVPEERFKRFVAAHYLLTLYDDIWSIRIMSILLRIIGVRAAFITAMNERNFSTMLGSKLNDIPTVGILHGVASRYSTPYDYMSGFNSEKMLSVDKYGVWSEWWKEHYIKESDAYKPEQLYVSGPMRPLTTDNIDLTKERSHQGIVRVLFVSEQAAVPEEVMPYLNKLINCSDVELTIKFRSSNDRFESWLLENEPSLLKHKNVRILKGDMQEAIKNADVVVGCHSTGVLEALLYLKVPIFLDTRKWGDYYEMKKASERQIFLVQDPEELIRRLIGITGASTEVLVRMREQYFGNPEKNGSAWVVDKLEEFLRISP